MGEVDSRKAHPDRWLGGMGVALAVSSNDEEGTSYDKKAPDFHVLVTTPHVSMQSTYVHVHFATARVCRLLEMI